MKLNEIDNIVLDIVGKDSPAVKGIGVGDSFGVGEKKHGPKEHQVLEEISDVAVQPKTRSAIKLGTHHILSYNCYIKI